MRVLAADIGGTKTLLAVVEVRGGRLRIVHERRYDSPSYATFEAMLGDFLAGLGTERAGIARAALAVPGPVAETEEGERAHVTNLPWQLDNRRLAAAVNLPAVRLINDFQAVGHGIAALDDDDLVVLQGGRPRPHAPRVVLGAGTGLGVAQLVWQRDRYTVLASEGGHADFAPYGPLQRELLAFLAERYDHVSVERLLSGPGLVNIYRFLSAHRPDEASPGLARAMAEGDPAAAIADHARRRADPLAVAALDVFVDVYGAQAGNLALISLPYGGVFIAGGIAPKILDLLTSGRFIRAFNRKGRMSALTAAIPVSVVINPRVGLLGAARVAACHTGQGSSVKGIT